MLVNTISTKVKLKVTLYCYWYLFPFMHLNTYPIISIAAHVITRLLINVIYSFLGKIFDCVLVTCSCRYYWFLAEKLCVWTRIDYENGIANAAISRVRFISCDFAETKYFQIKSFLKLHWNTPHRTRNAKNFARCMPHNCT